MITLTDKYKPEYPPIADHYKWVYADIEWQGETYPFRTSCPEAWDEAEIQAYLETKHDDFVCEIYRQRFPEVELVLEDKETPLEAWVRLTEGLTPEPFEPTYDKAEVTKRKVKEQAFLANLPSWPQVSDAVDNISNLGQAKVFMKKLARITYWLARNQED